MPPDITIAEARAVIRVPRLRSSSPVSPWPGSSVTSMSELLAPPGSSDAWGVGVAVGGPVRANVTASDSVGVGVGVAIMAGMGIRVGQAVGPGVNVGVGVGTTVGSQ